MWAGPSCLALPCPALLAAPCGAARCGARQVQVQCRVQAEAGEDWGVVWCTRCKLHAFRPPPALSSYLTVTVPPRH
jgi:hypothetical protein